MKEDKIQYIFRYYFSYMDIKEKIAWRHWSSLYKMEGVASENREKRIKINLKRGWMTNDEEILGLLAQGIDDFRLNVALRIDSVYDIPYNTCPKCNQLARTPYAKQCRYCFYDWH